MPDRTPVKVRAGLYSYRGRYAIQTTWDGPRGGLRLTWEIASDDEYAREGIVIDGDRTYRTLRDALAAIDREADRV